MAAAAAGFADLKRRVLSPSSGGGAIAVATAAAAQPQLAAAAAPLLGAGDRGGAAAGAGAGAAGPTLLDDVSVLLSGTASVRQQLAGGTAQTAAEDYGISLDDGGAAGGAAADGGLDLGAPAGLVVDEVVVERWYEYESRDAADSSGGGGGGWSGDAPLARPGGAAGGGGGGAKGAEAGGPATGLSVERSGGSSSAPASAARKEDVPLPEGGGWRWHGDWSAVVQAGRTDGEGWEYRSDQGEGSVGGGQRGWAAQCTADCARRRRCWVRRRRRQPRALLSGVVAKTSSSPAAPAAPAPPAADGTPAAGAVGAAAAADGSCCEQGMVLVVVALCSLLRGCQLLESKVGGACCSCALLAAGSG